MRARPLSILFEGGLQPSGESSSISLMYPSATLASPLTASRAAHLTPNRCIASAESPSAEFHRRHLRHGHRELVLEQLHVRDTGTREAQILRHRPANNDAAHWFAVR